MQQQLTDLQDEPNNKICDNYEPEFIGKYRIEENTRKSWNIRLE